MSFNEFPSVSLFLKVPGLSEEAQKLNQQACHVAYGGDTEAALQYVEMAIRTTNSSLPRELLYNKALLLLRQHDHKLCLEVVSQILVRFPQVFPLAAMWV